MARRSAKDPTEDIEAVLGRFQAWSEARSGTKSGIGREAKAAKDGVREISYEEALAASRSRWKGRDGDAASAAADESGAARRNVSGNGTRNGSGNSSFTLERPAGAASVIPPVFPASPPTEVKAPLAVVNQTAPLPASCGVAAGVPAPSGEVRPGEVRRTSLRQEFRTVLTQSVTTTAPRAAAPRARNEEAERQVSMSLRVAVSEQAMIRRRAAEAGISASAYLRQCALDVEILRAQVQGYMAAAAARDRIAEYAEAPRAMLPMATEGWLSRLQRKLWGARATQLSLKA